MRANYAIGKDGRPKKKVKCFTEEELKDFLDVEWEQRQTELYRAATKDVAAQVLATMFATLYKPPYNWRKDRLLTFKSNVEATFRDMTTGILGKDFSTVDCIEFMKREFGIDFDAEVRGFSEGVRSDAK